MGVRPLTIGVDPSVWRGRRVLVTGHTGFKGAWLSWWLSRMGAEVHGLALDAAQPSLWREAALDEVAQSRIGDIRGFDAVLSAFERARPEVVFHMAAQALVRASYVDPVGTYATNVQGTVHVLEAARRASGLRAVVIVTSDKCYENREWVWPYRENDRLGGHDPYSNSKACAELVTAAYADSFVYARATPPFGLASARAGNVIGGGDWADDRLIPDLVRGFRTAQPASIRNPAAVRPWQHVLEPLSGYLEVGARLLEDPLRWRGAWNFGPDLADARPVQWIADRAVERWGQGARWLDASGEQPHEARMLKLDISKARAELGWRPRWTVAEAIERTLDWYRDHQRDSSRASVRGLMERDISAYLAV